MSDPSARLPPGVHVLERGWLSANNILLLGSGESVLVDSGYVTHATQTVTLIEHVLRTHRRPLTLDRVLNTHLHADHCGGNAHLRQHFACRVTIPAAEADSVASWNQDALSFLATGQQCPRFDFDDCLMPGALLRLGGLDWQVLAAPGHDPHAVLLYCAQAGVLISGDALWQNGFGVIFPELAGEPGFGEVRNTLDLIAGLDIRLVIPGHGAPFTGVGTALQSAYARLDYLQADPLRNAQNAVKVLLKFLLLERQAIALADMPALMAAIPLLAHCNQHYFQWPPQVLADWAIQQLLKAGAATLSDTHLRNAG